MIAAKYRIERKTLNVLQSSPALRDGEAPADLDPRAALTLSEFFYEHLREKYVLMPTLLLMAHATLKSCEKFRNQVRVVDDDDNDDDNNDDACC